MDIIVARRSKRKTKLIIYFSCVAIVFSAAFGYFDISMNDTVKIFAESDLNLIIGEFINSIILDSLKGNNIDYYDLVKLEKDQNGRVSAVLVDSVKLNRVKSELSSKIINKFSDLENREYGIPIGTILKSRLFSGRGFKVYIKIIPQGSFASSVDNIFTSAGINQSLHSIYLRFNAMVKVVAPFSEATVSVTEKFCLAETVLLGEVPNTYVQIKSPDGEFFKYGKGD